MKSVFELTAYDNKIGAYIYKSVYSSKKVALQSFDNLKEHIIEVNELHDVSVQTYNYDIETDLKTCIIGDLNISLRELECKSLVTKF